MEQTIEVVQDKVVETHTIETAKEKYIKDLQFKIEMCDRQIDQATGQKVELEAKLKQVQ